MWRTIGAGDNQGKPAKLRCRAPMGVGRKNGKFCVNQTADQLFVAMGPHYAVAFAVLGAAVLAVTGAEAMLRGYGSFWPGQ
jgi:hypothetical protein